MLIIAVCLILWSCFDCCRRWKYWYIVVTTRCVCQLNYVKICWATPPLLSCRPPGSISSFLLSEKQSSWCKYMYGPSSSHNNIMVNYNATVKISQILIPNTCIYSGVSIVPLPPFAFMRKSLHCNYNKNTVMISIWRVASSPRPSLHGKESLVHTDCTCAPLCPESGYIIYTRKHSANYLRLCHCSSMANECMHDASLFEWLDSQQKQKGLPRSYLNKWLMCSRTRL